ncbi:MAG: 50S ribosomal protein L22 [Candidatus Omnitrophota bacterium]
MVAKAILRYIRVAPNKLRDVINLIRGKDASYAINLLLTIDQQPRVKILKLLNSAVANAKQKGLNVENLYISKIVAEAGPTWKRFRAAAFGRATEIRKRTSHLKIELDLKTK